METFLPYLVGVVLVWQIILTVLFLQFRGFLSAFTKGISTQDLSTLLAGIGAAMKKLQQQLMGIQSQVAVLEKQSTTYFQKVGFVRYNPFSDTGGDQSFCICLLDNDKHGFVITSLHSREHTRIYAKKITAGVSESMTLSKEEQAALNEALKTRSSTT